MLQTTADDIWAQSCLAYHVQPHMHQDTQAALANLQKALDGSWPEPLHLAPAEALHVTIYALVPVKAQFEKEAYWRRIDEPCRALLDRLCSEQRPLDLRFSRLKVTDTAIVAVGQDETGLIEAVRREIASVLPPPPGCEPLRYDLIHTTLARYQTSAHVPASTVEAVESMPVMVPAPVERLKIIRETLFPCLDIDELASFPLQ